MRQNRGKKVHKWKGGQGEDHSQCDKADDEIAHRHRPHARQSHFRLLQKRRNRQVEVIDEPLPEADLRIPKWHVRKWITDETRGHGERHIHFETHRQDRGKDRLWDHRHHRKKQADR